MIVTAVSRLVEGANKLMQTGGDARIDGQYLAKEFYKVRILYCVALRVKRFTQ